MEGTWVESQRKNRIVTLQRACSTELSGPISSQEHSEQKNLGTKLERG